MKRPSQTSSKSAAELLERADLPWSRRTEQRQQLIWLIRQFPGQFRAADLLERARPLGIGRATIFRLLEQLVQAGVLSRLHGQDGKSAYALCNVELHHHHLVCSVCGRVTAIETGGIESQLRALAREHGFQVDSHYLEVFGSCGDCSETT